MSLQLYTYPNNISSPTQTMCREKHNITFSTTKPHTFAYIYFSAFTFTKYFSNEFSQLMHLISFLCFSLQEVLHTISSPHGQVQRIVIFKKNGVQAMVEYPLQNITKLASLKLRFQCNGTFFSCI